MQSPRRGMTIAGSPGGDDAFPTPSPNFRFSGYLSKLGEGRVAWKVSVACAACAFFHLVFQDALHAH